MLQEQYIVKFAQKVYQLRFFFTFVAIGLCSLLLEFVLYRGFERIGFHFYMAYGLGFGGGLFFAYWLNTRFNFKVPKLKRRRAFLYFVAISLFSACLNFIFRIQLHQYGLQFEESRLLSSSLLFIFAYWLHRKFSFKDCKNVGIAVYANGLEDIKKIFSKIGSFSDFIHVDIIDHTFGEKKLKPKAYRLETIRAYWPEKPLHVHLMSRIPDFWLPEVLPYADLIYLHVESAKSLDKAFKKIRAAGKSPGLAIMLETPLKKLNPYLANVDTLLMLSIKKPGKSGQKFEFGVLEKINQLNRNLLRNKLKLCVDGGVDRETVQLLNVEMIVSGSYVLNSKSPKKEIIRLQNATNLENL